MSFTKFGIYQIKTRSVAVAKIHATLTMIRILFCFSNPFFVSIPCVYLPPISIIASSTSFNAPLSFSILMSVTDYSCQLSRWRSFPSQVRNWRTALHFIPEIFTFISSLHSNKRLLKWKGYTIQYLTTIYFYFLYTNNWLLLFLRSVFLYLSYLNKLLSISIASLSLYALPPTNFTYSPSVSSTFIPCYSHSLFLYLRLHLQFFIVVLSSLSPSS